MVHVHENDDVETISVVPNLTAQAAEGMVIEDDGEMLDSDSGSSSEEEGSESSSEDEGMDDAEE